MHHILLQFPACHCGNSQLPNHTRSVKSFAATSKNWNNRPQHGSQFVHDPCICKHHPTSVCFMYNGMFFFLNSVYIFWFQPQLTWDIAQVVTCCQCSDSLMIHCYSLLTRETFNLLCLCHANQSCHKQLSCLFISTWNVNMVSLIALPIPTFPYISYTVHIVHIVLRIVESDCGFENILAKRFLVAFKAKPHRQSHLLCRTRLSRVVTRCLPAFTRNGFRVAQYP